MFWQAHQTQRIYQPLWSFRQAQRPQAKEVSVDLDYKVQILDPIARMCCSRYSNRRFVNTLSYHILLFYTYYHFLSTCFIIL